jgi:nickel superoxide dismutase
MKKIKAGMMVIFALLAVGGGPLLRAHCQVPCGIYDDEARFRMLAEHVTTMEKAMKEIAALSAQAPVNYNQIVRWVMNKEKHAEEFSEILSYYFLAQRIKPTVADDKESHDRYLSQLELVHLLGKLQKSYFAKK